MTTDEVKEDYNVAATSNTDRSSSDLDASIDGNVEDRYANIDRKRLLRKVDFRILPFLCLCYMVVRLDLNSTRHFPCPTSLREIDLVTCRYQQCGHNEQRSWSLPEESVQVVCSAMGLGRGCM